VHSRCDLHRSRVSVCEIVCAIDVYMRAAAGEAGARLLAADQRRRDSGIGAVPILRHDAWNAIRYQFDPSA
jgi:hypothetical protein